MRFHDRQHAGQLLGARLQSFRPDGHVVLGLTRGGIPVASEVARVLGAQLDFIVVRKIARVDSPEDSVGAIAEGGAMFLIPATMRKAGLSQEQAEALADRGVGELARRIRLYRGEIPAPHVAGRTVIIVDDFVETGASACAAARAARLRGATRVVLAVPVIARGAEAELRRDFDEVVWLEMAPQGQALVDYYERLGEVSDEAAIALVRSAREGSHAGEGATPSR